MTQHMTWTCHVCHEERPDAQISVLKRRWTRDGGFATGGIEGDMNVRYCNDRPACVEGAKQVKFLKGVEYDEPN